MTWILGIIKIIVLLGTLITIHELGHFLVARLFKVRVLKFAIGLPSSSVVIKSFSIPIL